MNQQEWKDYFEIINSRKPNEEEIAKALASGEFSEEKPSEKKDIESQNTEEKVNQTEKDNEAVAQLTKSAGNYFIWLWETLKHPTTKANNYSQLYPWLTMGLIGFFVALTMTLNLRGVYSNASNGIYNLGQSFVTSSYMSPNPFGFGTFIGFFIGVSILIIVIVFATWVGLKVIGSRVTFTTVVDQYASLYVPVVALLALSSLLALVHLRSLGFISLYLAFMILSVSLYFIIFNTKNERKMDNFYAKLLALLASSAIIGGFILILITVIFANLLTSIQQFL